MKKLFVLVTLLVFCSNGPKPEDFIKLRRNQALCKVMVANQANNVAILMATITKVDTPCIYIIGDTILFNKYEAHKIGFSFLVNLNDIIGGTDDSKRPGILR